MKFSDSHKPLSEWPQEHLEWCILNYEVISYTRLPAILAEIMRRELNKKGD